MAPVSRRSFLAGLIAAPVIAAIAPKVFEPMRDVSSDWLGECYETPDGLTITSVQHVGDRLFVFTERSVYELKRG